MKLLININVNVSVKIITPIEMMIIFPVLLWHRSLLNKIILFNKILLFKIIIRLLFNVLQMYSLF
jgi:hypothetical protein